MTPSSASRARHWAFVAILGLASIVAEVASTLAEDMPRLRIDGAVSQALTLSASDLAALPQSDVRVAYLTGHGPEDAVYSGVLLWSLLEKAGIDAVLKDKKARAAHLLMLTARDGYRVAISIGEIDPDLEGKAAIVALKRDGTAVDAKEVFRIALPGDKHGARNMHALTHIEVQ